MPVQGDTFTIELMKTHLEWGTYRNTDSRKKMTNESYIPIPSSVARSIGIYNSNYGEGLGKNIFNVVNKSDEKLFQIKSSGNSKAGDIYAKNFHGSGDLSLIHNWFISQNAKVGDTVKLTWVSNTDVYLELI